jgi:hypothetical protein
MNNGCPTHGWSVIASAPMDSQLAGVLAGFVFTGIVLLFGRRGPKNIYTLGLFCAAFVILGFDSYLFGELSGGALDPYCVRIWTEEMTAAGMLAVGAMAIITGISWLLASHLDAIADISTPPDSSISDRKINLDRLVRIMAHGVGVTATLLLGVTTYDYIATAFPAHVPGFLVSAALISPALVAAALAGLASLRARRTRRRDVALAAVPNTALQIAAYGILTYALAGPVFVGIIGEFGRSWWQPPSDLFVGAAIIFGLVLPALLLIALVQAVPPLSGKYADGSSDAGKSEPAPIRSIPH